MAANPIPHATECISDCVSAIRSWREAVREFNNRPSPERRQYEIERCAEMWSFHPAVIEAAESYLSRSR